MQTFRSRWFQKLEKPWPIELGGMILGVLAFWYFIFGKTVGVQTTVLYWGVWLGKTLGFDASSWSFFQGKHAKALLGGFWHHAGSLLVLGIIVGSLLGALTASEFRVRRIASGKQLLAASLGGLLMGYGGRVATTCNVGVYFGLIPSQSLSGWLFMAFVFLGAGVGSWMLIKYFT
ncbi:YeeE/YedE thiosulfate transporter family protein [Calderihabitans maritimus]|nr:YeeE/YedE thiosulfate transporter family protein [Calderihabitans maritimus]